MPRSGTTLLTSMLSAHPRIAIAPETHYLCYWMRQYKTLDLSSPKDFETFWQAVSRSQRFSYFGINAHKTRERILAKGVPSHQHVLWSWLEEYAHTINKPRWGEKTPLHYQHLDSLLTWFPNARIVWMLRDPRAVTASLNHVPWASSYAHIHAQKWQESLTHFEQKWQKDPRVMLLQYEAFVQQPESHLIDLCQFLDETYIPQMLTARNEDQNLLTNRQGWAVKHLKTALQPVSAKSITKWQQELAHHQIEIVDALTFPQAANYGYISTTSHPMSLRARLGLALDKLRVKLDRKLARWQKRRPSGEHIGAAPFNDTGDKR